MSDQIACEDTSNRGGNAADATRSRWYRLSQDASHECSIEYIRSKSHGSSRRMPIGILRRIKRIRITNSRSLRTFPTSFKLVRIPPVTYPFRRTRKALKQRKAFSFNVFSIPSNPRSLIVPRTRPHPHLFKERVFLVNQNLPPVRFTSPSRTTMN